MTLRRLHNPTAERRVYDAAGHAVDPHTTVHTHGDEVTDELILAGLLIDNGPSDPDPTPGPVGSHLFVPDPPAAVVAVAEPTAVAVAAPTKKETRNAGS